MPARFFTSTDALDCFPRHSPERLAHEITPKAKTILVKADQVADALGLDGELLDGVVVGLGLE